MFALRYRVACELVEQLALTCPFFPMVSTRNLIELRELCDLRASSVQDTATVEHLKKMSWVLGVIIEDVSTLEDAQLHFFSIFDEAILDKSGLSEDETEHYKFYCYAISSSLICVRRAFKLQQSAIDIVYLCSPFSMTDLVAFILWMQERHVPFRDILATGIIQRFLSPTKDYLGVNVDVERRRTLCALLHEVGEGRDEFAEIIDYVKTVIINASSIDRVDATFSGGGAIPILLDFNIRRTKYKEYQNLFPPSVWCVITRKCKRRF